MSRSRRQVLQKLEDFSLQARSRICYRNSVAMSSKDSKVYKDALIAMAAVWSDMSSSQHSLTRLLNTLIKWDVNELVSCLKLADSLLLEEESACGFKRRLRQDYPGTWSLIAPLWGDIVDWFDDYKPTTFRRLHQCFVFITRLTLSGADDLQEKAKEAFLANEARLASITDLPDLNNIVKSWFPPKMDIWSDFDPVHGSGSTAELSRTTGLGPAIKNRFHGPDLTIKWWLKTIGRSDLSDPIIPGNSFTTMRVAKYTCVPKGIDKVRGICMEPTTLMFYQQGIMRSIISAIEHRDVNGLLTHPLGKRISLSHQEYNRELCQAGSIDGHLVTVDMSSASDSVSLSLVKKWFRGTPLYNALLATASRYTDIDGRRYKNVRFAPMGSAVCFPVECIVFAAICVQAILDSNGDPSRSLYRVYGDDIIIEVEYLPALERLLERCGFLVNHEKSFTSTYGPLFRESCGAEYLDGIDVQAYRIPRSFTGFKVSPASPRVTETLIAMSNDTLDRLPTLRAYALRRLAALNDLYPITSFDTSGVHAYDPTNYRIKKVWDKNLFQAYYVHGGSVLKSPKGVLDETAAYYTWLFVNRNRVPSYRFPYLSGQLHPEQVGIQYMTTFPRRWSFVRTATSYL